MRQKTLKHIFQAVVFLLAIIFILKFAGITVLRLYIQTGIGNCRKIPILCVSPAQEIPDPAVNAEYLAGLVNYNFRDMEIQLPKDFTAVKESITKVYYRHKDRRHDQAVVYLLYKEPGFFINLFPHLVRQGVKNNADFLTRTMQARITEIGNVTDAFFVVMKSIFIPDLGEQRNASMVRFSIADRRGFLNYNLSRSGNYFDCNIITNADDFFKVYIKDRKAVLDLDKVIAIISTVKRI